MRKLAKNLIVLALMFSFTNVYAKIINLYDAPKADAKIVGTVNAAKGITVIFAPKNSDYLKVGDPSNGNVGWIKHSDIKRGDQITFTHSMIEDGEGTHAYQFVEYGAQPVAPISPQQPQKLGQPLTQEQIAQEQERQMKALQQQTQEMQNLMNKAYNDMMGLFFKLGEQPAFKPPVRSLAPKEALPQVNPPQPFQHNVGDKPPGAIEKGKPGT